MLRLLILGATGSVGRSTLQVAALHPDKISVVALAARRDVEGMFELVAQFRPAVVAMEESAAAQALRDKIKKAGHATEVVQGAQAICELAADGQSDTVMSAIVGAVGLAPTLSAIEAGKRVLVANKEPLVMAGDLMMARAREKGAVIMPIDSEHNAIFQCLPGGYRCGDVPEGVSRITLTASGGPFREMQADELRSVTPEQAVRHPNWEMGKKISVDSATMMNKGLERIEAAVLYGLPRDQIDIVVHPESVIHSMVEYVDGSTLAQLGQPDMRVPIAHALAWPERWESGVGGLNLAAQARLTFSEPDPKRFPCLRLAASALQAGGNLPNVLNAANEIAVEAFLQGQLGFMAISEMVERVCDEGLGRLSTETQIEAVMASDAWAREQCRKHIREHLDD